MESIPPDCLEVIARSIVTTNAPWLCDAVADAANLSLAGNDTCTALSRMVQEAVEPGCTVGRTQEKHHLFLSDATRRAHHSSKMKKRWLELDKFTPLIRYSWRATALANRYAEQGDTESLDALAEMDARMTELNDLLEDRGCTLRNDSELCKAYIIGGIGHPPTIADTMEEMKFYFTHTEYRAHMQSWHFSDLAKEVALAEWVKEHGALSTLLPASLRDAATEMAIASMLDHRRVPIDLRQKALELIRGLDNIDTLLTLQSELGERLEAANNAVERIALWGEDATAFFGSESDVLMADEETYKQRLAESQAMWDRGEFTCRSCQKSWGSAHQLADHFRGKHGVVPDGLTQTRNQT